MFKVKYIGNKNLHDSTIIIAPSEDRSAGQGQSMFMTEDEYLTWSKDYLLEKEKEDNPQVVKFNQKSVTLVADRA